MTVLFSANFGQTRAEDHILLHEIVLRVKLNRFRIRKIVQTAHLQTTIYPGGEFSHRFVDLAPGAPRDGGVLVAQVAVDVGEVPARRSEETHELVVVDGAPRVRQLHHVHFSLKHVMGIRQIRIILFRVCIELLPFVGTPCPTLNFPLSSPVTPSFRNFDINRVVDRILLQVMS